MGLVMRVCDQVVVLDFGEVIAAGTPAEVQRDDRVSSRPTWERRHERCSRSRACTPATAR